MNRTPFPKLVRLARPSLFALLAAVTAAAGCSSKTGAVPKSSSNLVKLVSLYNVYTTQNRAGPASEAEFKKYILGLKPEGLQSLGIDPAQIDSYFVSSRDNKPYKFLYKVRTGDPTKPPVIAYEQDGSGGTREVAFLNGVVQEVDEAKFKELVPKP